MITTTWIQSWMTMPLVSGLVHYYRVYSSTQKLLIEWIGILTSYTCGSCNWGISMQVFLYLLQSLTLIHRNDSMLLNVKWMWNVKLKHNTGRPWLWNKQQACQSNRAIITITCLYTAGSSIREFPMSPCQHINLHKCIYHITCMLTPTYCISYSWLNEWWADIYLLKRFSFQGLSAGVIGAFYNYLLFLSIDSFFNLDVSCLWTGGLSVQLW